MHALYGTAWGVPLGLVAGSLHRRPPSAVVGGLFGIGVWGASLVLLPALKLSEPATEQSRSALAADLAMHLVYGAAAGAVYTAVTEPD